ncbi:UNVERIFIED_CONTAM: hypothetical protein K2H54_006314 [Gekko kuhli]
MRPGTTTALQGETRSKEEDMPPKDRSPLLPGKAFSDDLRAKDSAPREAVGPCVGARDVKQKSRGPRGQLDAHPPTSGTPSAGTPACSPQAVLGQGESVYSQETVLNPPAPVPAPESPSSQAGPAPVISQPLSLAPSLASAPILGALHLA